MCSSDLRGSSTLREREREQQRERRSKSEKSSDRGVFARCVYCLCIIYELLELTIVAECLGAAPGAVWDRPVNWMPCSC